MLIGFIIVLAMLIFVGSLMPNDKVTCPACGVKGKVAHGLGKETICYHCGTLVNFNPH